LHSVPAACLCSQSVSQYFCFSVEQSVTEYNECKNTSIKNVKIERLRQESKCSINVTEQLSRYEVTIVSFCRQAEVVAPGSKAIVVTVLFWKELLQDVMLAVLDAFEQSFVGVLSKLGRSRVTAAIQVAHGLYGCASDRNDTTWALVLTAF